MSDVIIADLFYAGRVYFCRLISIQNTM